MQKDKENDSEGGRDGGNLLPVHEADVEKGYDGAHVSSTPEVMEQSPSSGDSSKNPALFAVVVSSDYTVNGDLASAASPAEQSCSVDSSQDSSLQAIMVCNGSTLISHAPVTNEESPSTSSPQHGGLLRSASSIEHFQCRVCQQEKEEVLIDLGCKCKGGLAKAHRSCIDTWFLTRGSNKCEICQDVSVNVASPPLQTNYWIWRIDPTFRPQSHYRGCFSFLWVAFSILIGSLLLDVLISITVGVTALPINIIIGVIVALGLGTALRLALEFCREWSFRRVTRSVDANFTLGYQPPL